MAKTAYSKNSVVIRYPQMGDISSLWKYINALSQEKTYVTFQGERISLKKEKEFLKEALKNIKEKKSVILLLFVKKELGGVMNLDLGKRTQGHIATIGISIGKKFRGQGLGKLLMDTGIKEAKRVFPGLKILNLCVFSENGLARKMYQKFGFKEYGKLPGGILYKGKYVDDVFMYKRV